ncbi:MAG: hypothetical protein M1819_005729 [Sarea resinae]|nr:MAG: hypothetical protein M1819_005729 [Sarea resinae]
MSLEILTHPPETSTFTPLTEHQSHTPASFFNAPPVLHHHASSALLLLSRQDLPHSAVTRDFVRESQSAAAPTTTTTTTNGDAAAAAHTDDEDTIVLAGFEVWVTSESLLLYSTSKATGLQIPYPSIFLHAIQRLRLPASASISGTSSGTETQGLYMQIADDSTGADADENENGTENGAGEDAMQISDDDDDEGSAPTFALTIIPSASSTSSSPSSTSPSTSTTPAPTAISADPAAPPTEALFAALSACANLHPDPPSQPSSRGSPRLDTADLSIPGSSSVLGSGISGLGGGWITSENMHEYFDADGNPRVGGGGGALGPGAGSVRARAEDADEDEVGEAEVLGLGERDGARDVLVHGDGNGDGNGDGDADGEGEGGNKWRRTG